MTNLLRRYWKNYSTLGTLETRTEEENAKIRLMNQAYLFAIIGFFTSFLPRILLGYTKSAILGPLIPMIIFMGLPFFSYLKRPKVGWHIASIVILLCITFAATQRPVLYANYLIYGTIIFLLIYLHNDNKNIQFGYLIFTALNVVAFAFLSQKGTSSSESFPIIISLIIIFIALATNYVIISLSFNYRGDKERQLSTAISLKNAAFNANKDATLIMDAKRKITGFNNKYLELWKTTREEMNKFSTRNLIDVTLSQIKNKREIIDGLAQIEKDTSIETFHLLHFKDGRIVESHTQPQIHEGRIVGRVYNYRDVTAKHLADEKLAASERRFRRFFEDSPLGIAILENKNQPFKKVNQKFCDMFGYTQSNIVNLNLVDLCSPDFLKKHIQEYREFSKSGATQFSSLNKYQKKSGESFWGQLNISVLKDENGKKVSEIIMLEDVNEQKEQEEKIKNLIIELKILNEKLEQEVKVRTVDLQQSNLELRRSNQDLEQFAYIASHDLQEPLRMVGNFVQLLERQYNDKIDEEGKEFIKYIVDGVNRMSKLIQNLLKYSRVGRKESALRTVKLDRIVEAKLFGLTQKIIDTEAVVEIVDMPKEVFCEPDQIGMVFYNLITNALKFSKEVPTIEIGYKNKSTELLFYVKDNGIGIDSRYETKVFEIFKRLHRREDYEGTGIGLALCKKIIARHGGRIWFESELNKGTIFYFTISKSLINEKYVPLDTNLVG